MIYKYNIFSKADINTNNSIPTYSTSYQINKLSLKRKWNYSGAQENMADYYPIICEKPGDLWTLGSLIN